MFWVQAQPAPLGEGAHRADEGFIDNVIARSLHGKRRSNPVKTVNLPDCFVGLTRCNDALGEGD
ncbi:MAG: hypothetical protein LBK53_00760 [Heliobacteriaceae bacterium]|nr:hypothetical protein [Heliobacteriaceae bacterium]